MLAPSDVERPRGSPKRAPALGPFPRSIWIHPDIPEDELDRVCFRIWRRSVLAQRGIWPHLAENVPRFMHDPLMMDINSISRQKRPEEILAGMLVRQYELEEWTLLIKREKGQMPQHQSDTMAPDPGILDETIISVTEANQRKIERFLKDVLIPDHDKKKEASFDSLSMEDFPPLPSAAAPWNRAQRDQAKKDKKKKASFDNIPKEDSPPLPSAAAPWNRAQSDHAKKEISSIQASSSKSQVFNHLTDPNPRRNKRLPKNQKFKPVTPTKSAIMEEIEELQVSKNRNELCIQPSDPSQRGDVTEPAKVKVSAEEAMSDGGGGLPGMSADGAHAPHNPAGTDTESMRKAAGTAKNAKNHLFQEDTTVPWWKTPGSASHKGAPEGHMARVQEVELGNSSRSIPRNVAFPVPQAYVPSPCKPYPGYPAPRLPMHHPPGFVQPQINPVMAYALLICGMLPPVPPFQNFHMPTNSYWQPPSLHHSGNFPGFVTSQVAKRQHFPGSPNRNID
ncbi:uncharacterized protein LOC113536281 [Pangasianodon hypophthalmus]|uniref:uncharacterized protein LOC113536281 n=1 Tax=Pangasianodon hypophthalmus TaxID=310915 RepID=UPI00230706C5|nr:uncharacterized protein LOC113536281 [Pangasianodon hypophthalmus]